MRLRTALAVAALVAGVSLINSAHAECTNSACQGGDGGFRLGNGGSRANRQEPPRFPKRRLGASSDLRRAKRTYKPTQEWTVTVGNSARVPSQIIARTTGVLGNE